MGKPDYYRFLGLHREASTSQIKRRYQELAKQYHPDNGGDERLMGRINEAYAVLSDPKKRFAYNQSLNTGMVRYKHPMDVAKGGQSNKSNLPEVQGNENRAMKLYARKSAFGAAVAIALVAVIALGVLAFAKQKPQKPKTVIISKTEVEPSSSNQSNNSGVSQQVSQEEAKVKQEEDQANSDQALAQQYANEAKSNSSSDSAQTVTPTTNVSTTSNNTIYPPNTAPSPTALNTGDYLNGTYYYAVSFISDSGIETALGPASAKVTVKNGQVTLSNIPTGPGEVAARNIYRTKANGSAAGPFYLVTTIYDNTTTTKTDNVKDANLGSTGKYPT